MFRFVVMMAVSVAILVGCVAVSGEGDECPDQGGCAASNNETVPDVVGRTPKEACRTLESSDYGGVIRTRGDTDGAGEARVVAQDPKPGVEGGYQQGVRLTVSGSIPRGDLSSASNCVLADRP